MSMIINLKIFDYAETPLFVSLFQMMCCNFALFLATIVCFTSHSSKSEVNLLNAVPDDQEDIQGWWCEGDIEERILLFFVGGVTGMVP